MGFLYFIVVMDSASGEGGAGNMAELRQQHEQQRAHENAALDRLHASIMVTHSNATTMNRELNDQDRLLGNLEHGVTAANQEARSQTRSVGQLVEQTKGNGFIITVACLIVVIIVLLALP